MARTATGLLITTLMAAAFVLLLVWWGQRRAIYFPFGGLPGPREVGLAWAQAVSFETADGLTLAAWFVPATAPATATVILFNGNAGSRAMRAPLAAALSARGVAVLMVDYRGYGDNPGSPSERGLTADAEAARSYLDGRKDVDATRIAYFGESLGTAVAVRLATERPPYALILRSPFTSLGDVGRFHYGFLPVGLLLRDRFEAIEQIRGVSAPLLTIVGGSDSIVPPALSERLHAAAPGPKRLLRFDLLDHNDYELLAGRQVVEAIVRFLADPIGSTA